MNMATGTQAAMQGMNAPEGAMPQRQDDAKALLEALMELLKEGVASGDADADVPEVIDKMIGLGGDIAQALEALKQAAEASKVSPLLMAKAEKLLGTPNAGADEATDRSKILRYNKNMLTR